MDTKPRLNSSKQQSNIFNTTSSNTKIDHEAKSSESSTTTQQGPYDFKINVRTLIIGYIRSKINNKSSSKSSIIDTIFRFHPKMNGYKFTWKVQEKIDLSHVAIDSDPIDIGLPNQFFLQLQDYKLTLWWYYSTCSIILS